MKYDSSERRAHSFLLAALLSALVLLIARQAAPAAASGVTWYVTSPSDVAIGGSSVMSVVSPADPTLEATGGVLDLTGPAPARAGDVVRFTVTMTNAGFVDVTGITGSMHALPPGFIVVANSGASAGGSGFVANDNGFSGGALAAGGSANFTFDATLPSPAGDGQAVFTLDVGGNGIITIPVAGRINVSSSPRPTSAFRLWLPIVLDNDNTN